MTQIVLQHYEKPAARRHFWVGLVMAVCNLAGSYVGTRLALKHGAGFIRKAFLGVVVVLIAKQLADLAG